MNRFGFQEYGRVYLPIDIKPKDDITLYSVEFKVDTGADTTTISKNTLILFYSEAKDLKKELNLLCENERGLTSHTHQPDQIKNRL